MLGFEILGCASCDLYRGEMYLGLFFTALFWVLFRLFVLCRRDVGLIGGGYSMGWVGGPRGVALGVSGVSVGLGDRLLGERL